MKTISARIFGTGLAATMLVGVASTCLAGGGGYPQEVFPGVTETSAGVFTGGDRFPDTVFVMAEHSTAGQHVCDRDDSGGTWPGSQIANMAVSFETRTSGLARVSFCGALDIDGTPDNVRLAAQIDGENNCLTFRGVTGWNVDGSDPSEENSGPVCWEWICKVENDTTGRNDQGNTTWTEHEATVHCGTSEYRAKFNDRNMYVDYTHNHEN